MSEVLRNILVHGFFDRMQPQNRRGTSSFTMGKLSESGISKNKIENLGRSRPRITRACDLCKKKKIRCHFSPGQPCSNCVSYQVECSFSDETRKRGPPKGYAEKLEMRIEQVGEALRGLTGKTDIDALIREHSFKTGQRKKSKSLKVAAAHGGKDEETITGQEADMLQAFTEELDALHARQFPIGAHYNDIKYLGDMDIFNIFSNKLRLDTKAAKWKGHHIRRIGDVVVEDSHSNNPSVALNDKIPRLNMKPMTVLPRNIHQYVYAVTGLDQYTSTRLLKIYFANVHPILPVIDKGEFLKQYRDKTYSYPAAALLNAMFGAAARFAECESLDEERWRLVPPDARWELDLGWSDQFFERALRIISDSVNQPTLANVQASVLIQNHRANVDSKSSDCWLLGSLAHGLGLHRNCTDWPIPQNEKQSRIRTWWAVYVCDRFQSALHGHPLTITDEDNDVPYPDVDVSWEEVLDLAEPDGDRGSRLPRFPSATYQPKSTQGHVSIFVLFLQLVKLSEIIGRIWKGLHTDRAKQSSYMHGSDTIVAQLDRELTEWRFEFGRTIKGNRFEDFNQENGYFSGVIGSTLLFYFTALILLHRPFIRYSGSEGANEQSSRSSFWICTSAASRGIRLAAQLSAYDYLLTPYAFSLYPVLQFCLILMYNTKNNDHSISSAAKIDLQCGIHLIDRIHEISSTARKLKALVHSIIDTKSIDCELDYSVRMAERNYEGTGHETDHGDHSIQQRLQPGDSRNQETMSSYIGNILLQQPEVADTDIQASSFLKSLPTTNSEAFSLIQFGLELDTDGQAMNEVRQAWDSLLAFDDNLQPEYQSSFPCVPQITPLGTTTVPSSTSLPTQPASIFRNDPNNNPFWDMPSSIDWAAWEQWYQHADTSATAWDQDDCHS